MSLRLQRFADPGQMLYFDSSSKRCVSPWAAHRFAFVYMGCSAVQEFDSCFLRCFFPPAGISKTSTLVVQNFCAAVMVCCSGFQFAATNAIFRKVGLFFLRGLLLPWVQKTDSRFFVATGSEEHGTGKHSASRVRCRNSN